MKQEKALLTITLKTFYGLEQVLMEELNELGYKDVEKLNRAVQLKGTLKDVYFLNLNVRCALTVLVQIAQFKIKREDDLYKECLKIDWTRYFSIDKTFAIKGAVFSDLFRHTRYPYLVVKDAIADTFRKKTNARPDVNVKTPQVTFDVYINRDQVTIALNTSGAPLFKRGYREETGEAPLNEVVAAGLIRMSGWDRKSTFFDPFCGSGTLLIEAALLAAGLPSQMERTHFAFRNFSDFDPELWESVKAESIRPVSGLPCQIVGSDKSAEMVTKARRNLRRLSIGRFVETHVDSFQEASKPSESGIMISNPPYGERMGEEIEEMYEEIGDWMKNQMKGFDCWILSSNEAALKRVGLKPDRKFRVYNGDLECSFRKFAIYEGSKKQRYDQDSSAES